MTSAFTPKALDSKAQAEPGSEGQPYTILQKAQRAVTGHRSLGLVYLRSRRRFSRTSS